MLSLCWIGSVSVVNKGVRPLREQQGLPEKPPVVATAACAEESCLDVQALALLVGRFG